MLFSVCQYAALQSHGRRGLTARGSPSRSTALSCSIKDVCLPSRASPAKSGLSNFKHHCCRVPFLDLAHPSTKIRIEGQEAPKCYLPDLRLFVSLQDRDVTRKMWVSQSLWQKWVAWWRHQMETCSALLAFCAGNSPVPGEFPAQRPVMLSFDVFFDLRLNKRLSKQGEAGDLRRYHAHYDVTVMAWCPDVRNYRLPNH